MGTKRKRFLNFDGVAVLRNSNANALDWVCAEGSGWIRFANLEKIDGYLNRRINREMGKIVVAGRGNFKIAGFSENFLEKMLN